MSKPHAEVPVPHGTTLERRPEDVLRAARPLPPEDNPLIDDLTDDEDRLFLAAILDQ